MRAAVLTGFGGPENILLREVPDPSPAPGEVLVAVSAAAVNNTDINTRLNWYGPGGWSGGVQLPRIQGADVCGRIVEVGPGVRPDRIGQRVVVEPVLRGDGGPDTYLGSERDGGFAELVAVPAANAFAVTRGLSDAEWASFPCSYSTAENLLTRAQVAAGDEVLITGASGGVGSAAVQLAAARGAVVTAVTSREKTSDVAALGAVATLGRADGYGRNAFDVVVDLVGGPRFPDLLAALRPRGRYAVSGAIAGPMVDLDLRTLYLKDLTMIGGTIIDPGVFPALLRRIEDHQVRPVVSATFPLDRIREAQQEFERKIHVGKIVLQVANTQS